MLVARVEAFVVLLALLLHPIPATATTIVLFVTPHGIVMASDGKMTSTTVIGKAVSPRTSRENIRKIFCVQDRILVASVGKGYLDRAGQSPLHYEFSTWIKNLDAGLSKDVSVETLASIIKDESVKMLASFDLEGALRDGILHSNNPAESFGILIQYIIAGYQEGMPRVYLVEFYADWNDKRVIGPRPRLLDSGDSTHGNFRGYYFGITEAIADTRNTLSYANKRATSESPTAFGHLLAHHNISFDDTVSVARTLVHIEEEVNPSDVGGEIQVAGVLPDGRAHDIIDELNKPKRSIKKKHP